MKYLTDEKLAIFGSGGAIGSNMVQAALTMGLTPNIAMYDPYDKGNEGAAEEIYHCAFPGARVTWVTRPKAHFAPVPRTARMTAAKRSRIGRSAIRRMFVGAFSETRPRAEPFKGRSKPTLGRVGSQR